ncbi:TPA: hypothetical protein RI751_002622 [Vibrio cholerae]|uniref:hypothetical protein n=1 Tax=Vibrio TaxID=662 RepID=UPI0012EC237F|nr:hypothetical protein [Vibrio cholerae]EJL6396518.1 hypothetical protein [Vibrio navarrensis]EKO3394779.1 hypothetical protein [Vibrio fluvialis]MCX9577880.1 hypothetical protein [Vibrio cholerae]MCX9603246.1 hypothetical protein [Vibrio cholerae]MCX9605930.1 hypothetical protein [Vibrio cholerae]
MTNIDKIKDLAFQKQHYVEMFFCPKEWSRAKNITGLNWKKVDFPPSPKKNIPKKPGVYAFVVEPNLFDFSPGNGFFYVGKAQCLYDRVGAYVTDLSSEYDNKNTRAHIWMMLNLWNGHLKYYYVTTATEADAIDLEDQMIIAFRPHYNRKLDAIASREEKAFS